MCGRGRWSKVREAKRGVVRSREPLDGVERDRFPPAAHDHIEIVGAGFAGAEHVEAREVSGARRRAERRDGDELTA